MVADVPKKRAPSSRTNRGGDELSQKNEELAELVKRLMVTADQEKQASKKAIEDLVHESENKLTATLEKCQEEKQELAKRNEEIESELQALAERYNKNDDKMDCKTVLELRQRLLESSQALDDMGKAFGEADEERRVLRASNQRLEVLMKEHQETTHNFKILLESEVDELRCRLRKAEEKNLMFMQRSLSQMLPENRSHTSVGNGGSGGGGERSMGLPSSSGSSSRRVLCTGRCSYPKSESATVIKEECECTERPTTTESRAYDDDYEVFMNRCGESDGTRTRSVTLPTTPTRVRGTPRQLRSRRRPARNYPREILCLFFSVIILGLSYFVRALDPGCRYQTLPYSPPSTGN